MNTQALPFRLPLIAILRGIQPHDTYDHVGALVDEGWDAIEIPLNSPAWEESIRLTVNQFGAHVLIGAGTVLHESQVDKLAVLGAQFVVTPNTNAALIRQAVRREMAVVAGFATASEAFTALNAGAEMLKLFPASTYGPGHVRALRAVLPPVPLFAVGGVTPSNLAEYLSAGAIGAGIGGELYKPGQSAGHTRGNARAFRQAYEAVSS